MNLFKITFVAIICFIAIAGISCEPPARPEPAPSQPPLPEDALLPGKIRTWEEISQHATAEDCWLVIEGVVYDVSDFISEHAGGAEQITKWCGQDASFGFATKNDTGGSHSIQSKLKLDVYFVGFLQE